MEAEEPTAPIPGVPVDRTLLSVLAQLRAEGFEHDMFVTRDALVRCGACHTDMAPAQLQLNALRRLEGASDPADEAAVLALTCVACGARGTAVVRYGPEAEPQEDEVLRAVDDLHGR